MTPVAKSTLMVGHIAAVPVPLIDPKVQPKINDPMPLLAQPKAARISGEATPSRLLDSLLHNVLTQNSLSDLESVK